MTECRDPHCISGQLLLLLQIGFSVIRPQRMLLIADQDTVICEIRKTELLPASWNIRRAEDENNVITGLKIQIIYTRALASRMRELRCYIYLNTLSIVTMGWKWGMKVCKIEDHKIQSVPTSDHREDTNYEENSEDEEIAQLSQKKTHESAGTTSIVAKRVACIVINKRRPSTTDWGRSI